MAIEQTGLEELKQIYLKHYGVLLTDEQALDLGIKLVELFKVIARPIPKVDNGKGKDTQLKQCPRNIFFIRENRQIQRINKS